MGGLMEANSYDFAAIRGIQAGAAYYVIMCPMKLVPTLFRFDDDAVQATLRAQRVLNRARVPAIANYIAANEKEYILSSLCASVDGDMEFEPLVADGPLRSVGRLRIGLSAVFLINDGQHRRAAIEEAIRTRPYLGDETISVVIFADRGLKRAQQMFADLNMHAVKPTKSLRVLYDHRDALSKLVQGLLDEVPLFRDFTDLEKTSISNRSLKLFTLSSLHQATGELIRKPRSGKITRDDATLAMQFWTEVVACMPDWQRVQRREVASAELRRDYVHAHGLAIQAIAIAGAHLIQAHPHKWSHHIKKLSSVDWSRANHALWEGRALVAGRLNKSRNNVLLVSNVVLRAWGIPLSPEGEHVEAMFRPVQPPIEHRRLKSAT